MKNILKRFTAGTWVGIASLVVLILSTAGIDINTITSWSILGEAILKILSNPFTIFSIIGAIASFLNNPTTTKKF